MTCMILSKYRDRQFSLMNVNVICCLVYLISEVNYVFLSCAETKRSREYVYLENNAEVTCTVFFFRT